MFMRIKPIKIIRVTKYVDCNLMAELLGTLTIL
jgi:hypothetical protein